MVRAICVCNGVVHLSVSCCPQTTASCCSMHDHNCHVLLNRVERPRLGCCLTCPHCTRKSSGTCADTSCWLPDFEVLFMQLELEKPSVMTHCALSPPSPWALLASIESSSTDTASMLQRHRRLLATACCLHIESLGVAAMLKQACYSQVSLAELVWRCRCCWCVAQCVREWAEPQNRL